VGLCQTLYVLSTLPFPPQLTFHSALYLSFNRYRAIRRLQL